MQERSVCLLYNDRDTIDDLRTILVSHNYRIYLTNDVFDCINICVRAIIDVVIIDFSNKKNSGLEQIEIFRKRNSSIPVLFINNRNDVDTRIIAFNSGANDVINRPINSYELMARIKNLFRYNRSSSDDIFINGDLKINYSKKQVFLRDKEIHFTNIEYKVLVLFSNHLDEVLPYSFIIEKIRGKDGQDQNGLRVFISNIRRKLSTDKHICQFIRTSNANGYKMKKL
ncbi:MAG: response regulator transcription factor [Candidatus Onthovivens sp.]|nr:response regulator transcription factor [Candidatus Onthovivens sp.]